MISVLALLILIVPALSSGFAWGATNSQSPTSSAGNDPSSAVNINSVDQNGNAITGYYTALYSSSGSLISSGFTPASFSATVGTTYQVGADGYGSCTFTKWSDGVTTDPRTFTATSSPAAFTAVYTCTSTPPPGSSIAVSSVDQNGNAITGYYTELIASNGNVVASGFTPQTFTTTAGDTYSLLIDGYGSCAFAKWSTGSTSDPVPVTATSSAQTITADFQCSGVSGQGSTVSVNSVNQNNIAITGYWSILYTSTGTAITGAFTPSTFATTAGQSYQIASENYGSCTFTNWSDGVTTNPRPFTATSSALTFTADYTCTSGTTSTVTINSVNQDGNSMTGFPITMTYQGHVVDAATTTTTFGTTVGYTYQVAAGNANGCTFSNWSVTDNGSAVSFTATSSVQTLTAVYDCNNGGPNSITVYAHRIPAGYWAPCFALVCAAGTGPGASMYFALEYKNGTLVGSGFSDENGLVFSGLKPGVTYVLFADDCDLCHGSTHDVLFNHWGNGTTSDPVYLVAGTVMDAWYNCTNGCGGG